MTTLGTRAAAPVLLLALALVALLMLPPAPASAAVPGPRPPVGGFFQLRPVGSFATLPDDAQAAAMVHRSPWEPRPENAAANVTRAPAGFHQAGYGGSTHRAQVFGRITGAFTGTTDETIQWAAAKWGLPDDVVRAEAVVETGWYQDLKDANGHPVRNKGYGDFGDCGGSPPAAGYGPKGPSSFGLLQAKWCSLTDRPNRSAGVRTTGARDTEQGGWPWTERSTAYALDTYAAVIRSCYEGWDPWLGNGYKAGDLWGCVGRWFSGAWHTSAAEGYITKVKAQLAARPWERW